MNLLDKIEYIFEKEDFILPKKDIPKELDFGFDEHIFNRIANFIIGLDPELLDDNQLEEVLNIIEDFEIKVSDDEDELQEIRTPKLAKRTSQTKNQASKRWYRKNRTEIKRRKKKFRRSSEGRKRANARKRLARQGKTATGRKKVRYHIRKRSDRSDREKNLNR